MVPALLVRLATITAALLLSRRAAACRWVALGGSIVASGLTLAVAMHVLASGQPADGVLVRHAASGIVMGYSVTPLSAWFLMVASLIAIPVAWYSAGYFAHAVPASGTAAVGAAFNALLGAVEIVFVAGDVVTFLFAWELMTLATAALVVSDHESRASRQAGFLYLVMSHVGTGCLVVGFFTLVAASGSTSFATLLSGTAVSGPIRHGLFALFFVGFGVKAGVMPLHVWLPEAHPAAPSSVSALMSAVLITAGIYGLVRICAFGLGVPDLHWGLVLMIAGMLSAILGVLYALTQTDIKRLLAYSTIENAGIIILGLGAAMVALSYGRGTLAAIAIAASLTHVLNHAVFKGLLFLGAGGVVMATGTKKIELMGGLIRLMPWTGLTFLVGAMAIAGLPMLNGFPSEWLTYQSLLLGFGATSGWVRLSFPLGFALLALTSALSAACFVRAFGMSFLARPRGEAAATARESGAFMLIPQVFLAAGCVVLGLSPGLALSVLDRVLVSLPGVPGHVDLAAGAIGMVSSSASFDHVVPAFLGVAVLGALTIAVVMTWRVVFATRRVATWGCGGELSSDTEYTATAFSKPLLMIFRAVYRPTREVETLAEVSPYFPSEVRYRARIEPTFERYIYKPLARGVWRVAAGMKVLQAGSLHAYLAYVLVFAVLLLIWLGGLA